MVEIKEKTDITFITMPGQLMNRLISEVKRPGRQIISDKTDNPGVFRFKREFAIVSAGNIYVWNDAMDKYNGDLISN